MDRGAEGDVRLAARRCGARDCLLLCRETALHLPSACGSCGASSVDAVARAGWRQRWPVYFALFVKHRAGGRRARDGAGARRDRRAGQGRVRVCARLPQQQSGVAEGDRQHHARRDQAKERHHDCDPRQQLPHPCAAARSCACIFDEIAYWRDDTTATPDTETYTAVLPALLTTNGMLIGISRPYRRTGLLHAKHKQFFGADSDDTLVVQGPTLTFNRTLDPAAIAALAAGRPDRGPQSSGKRNSAPTSSASSTTNSSTPRSTVIVRWSCRHARTSTIEPTSTLLAAPSAATRMPLRSPTGRTAATCSMRCAAGKVRSTRSS